jgi:hypothetical protein
MLESAELRWGSSRDGNYNHGELKATTVSGVYIPVGVRIQQDLGLEGIDVVCGRLLSLDNGEATESEEERRSGNHRIRAIRELAVGIVTKTFGGGGWDNEVRDVGILRTEC